jgi:hypothetical protein
MHHTRVLALKAALEAVLAGPVQILERAVVTAEWYQLIEQVQFVGPTCFYEFCAVNWAIVLDPFYMPSRYSHYLYGFQYCCALLPLMKVLPRGMVSL